MSRRALSRGMILVCFCLIANQSHAWNDPPVAVISHPDFLWLHLDPDPMCFNGSGSYDPDSPWGWIYSWRWNFGDGHSDSDEDIHVPACVEHTYASIGRYYPDLKVWDAEGASSTYKYFTAIVVEVGLSLGPGYTSYVAVNDDDDNENSIFDNYYYPGDQQNEQLLVPGENDLVEIELYVDTPSSAGQVRLGVGPGEGCIRIWSDPNKQDLIIPDGSNFYKRWAPGAQPEKLYVEGITASPVGYPRSPKVMISYTRPAGAGGQDELIPDDGSNEIRFTVVHVDMDMDGVADERDTGSEPWKTEETKPGGIIPPGEVRKLTLKEVQPGDLTGNVTLSVATTGDGDVRIWDNEQMVGDPLALPATLPMPTEATYLWVEGYELSSSCDPDVELKLEFTTPGGVFRDRIRIAVVKYCECPPSLSPGPWEAFPAWVQEQLEEPCGAILDPHCWCNSYACLCDNCGNQLCIKCCQSDHTGGLGGCSYHYLHNDSCKGRCIWSSAENYWMVRWASIGDTGKQIYYSTNHATEDAFDDEGCGDGWGCTRITEYDCIGDRITWVGFRRSKTSTPIYRWEGEACPVGHKGCPPVGGSPCP